MPHATPQQSITAIREALIDVEDLAKELEDLAKELRKAAKKLHDDALAGLRAHGHLLVDPGEIEPLAGGGTPKLPPPPGN